MSVTPLFIGPDEREALKALRELAQRQPVDMAVLTEALKHPAGKAAHKDQMTSQSVRLPTHFLVTFSIEKGHPIGTCRHMSMSVGKPDRVPNPHAIWMVAEELGFVGGLDQCVHWSELLEGHGTAINVVQPIAQ
ncbi:hypothetical protein [Paraburkholderia sp. MM6662-R1]|uniref:hypothetical protein n=1 Tax=Paraburkholderia sp. MM6662-R1 TaxID=2991066 RepID=UPI003D259913